MKEATTTPTGERYLFDIEGDDLLPKITKVHCIVAINVDTGEVHKFGPERLQEGLALLSGAGTLIGHHILGYDIPALSKVFGWEPSPHTIIRDTLLLAKLIYPNILELDFERKIRDMPATMYGRQSLESWGYRLKFPKQEQPDFAQYTEEMMGYCVNDVKLNVRLWEVLQKRETEDNVVDLEHAIAGICYKQEATGIPFDIEKAQKLYSYLSARKDEVTSLLRETMEPTVITLKTKTKTIPFNPGSRIQIAERLMSRGWRPKSKTASGYAQIDETVLEGLKDKIPEAVLLLEYLLLDKRLGAITGWLKAVGPDGRIHGRVDTLGTGTHRCSHSGPNMAQVPSCGAQYGKECRELFYAPEGYSQVGVDVSRLELVMLAHYINDPAFTESLLTGDIHTTLAEVYGTPRGPGKNVTYAMIYGAGDEKLGATADHTIATKAARIAKGKEIRENIKKRLPSLDNLVNSVKTCAAKLGRVKLIDGRHIPVRSEHSALNFLLQGGGAVVCKQWVVNFHAALKSAGLYDSVQQVAFVHDELQLLVKHGLEATVGDMCVVAIEKAGRDLGVRLPVTGEYKVGRNWSETH